MIFEELERAALDEHEPRWAKEGYRLIRNPRREEIPDFLGRFRPDALAVGRVPNLIVEVVRKGAPNVEEKIRRLRSLLGDRKDWKIEILYSGEDEGRVQATSLDAIRDVLSSVRRLAEQEPKAALLMAWAGLEALARRLEPQNAARPQSPGRVVELLAGSGYVAPSDAERLRSAVVLRNKLIHGDLGVRPEPMEVRAIGAIAEELLRLLDQR